ncbi:MAG: hypothetical protein SVM79_09645 [Chloroflexota bacterium]|nr:hypothetical protein [Chloroflexota bacterium]
MNWLMNILNGLVNLFWKWLEKRVEKKLLKSIQSETSEEFLELLLKLMRLAFKVDKEFRRNIEGFKGKCQFRSIDDSVTIAAVFDGGELKVKEELIPNPDVSIIFKDGQSLMNYLLSDRDILKLVLNNEVVLKGNMNYMLKFGFMANHLQLALTGKLP